VVDGLPLTVNGKLDVTALPEPAPLAPRRVRAPGTPTEATLARIVAQVLGVEAVGVDEDFFALGGDSLSAIEITNRARAAGLDLRVRDVLGAPTVAGIASLTGEPVEHAPSRAGEADEVLPTPVMRWLESLGGPITGYHQAALIHSPNRFTADDLVGLAARLLDTHPTFRSALVVDDNGRWEALRVAPAGTLDPAAHVRRVDAAHVSDVDRSGLIHTETVAARDELDAGPGGMLRLVWLDGGPGRPGRLIVVAHHLAVDAVSWRLLADDVRAAGPGGGALPAPERTTFAEWSRTLAEHGASPAVRAEAEAWRRRIATGTPLPLLRPRDDRDVAATVRTHTVVLPAGLGATLLTGLPRRWGTGPDAVLLAALGEALRELGPARPVLVDTESHGRVEDLGGDLGRTVGWFTVIAPVPVTGGGTPEDAVRRTAAALREFPHGGLGYGLLRHPHVGEPAVPASGAEVEFNYLGRTGATGPAADDAWAAADNAAENTAARVGPAPDVRAGHALVVDAIAHDTAEGPVLETTFRWPAGVLDDGAVQRLAHRWSTTLTSWANG
jgi:non-ribosomal peptide synthase protein (TIGR01720 family)